MNPVGLRRPPPGLHRERSRSKLPRLNLPVWFIVVIAVAVLAIVLLGSL